MSLLLTAEEISDQRIGRNSRSSSSSERRSFTTSSSPPQEDAWLDAYRRLQPPRKSFTASRQMSIPISISRVNQFDAARLDIDVSAMLKEQLVKVFSLMKACKDLDLLLQQLGVKTFGLACNCSQHSVDGVILSRCPLSAGFGF